MSKSKTTRTTYNEHAVIELKAKYGVTRNYIVMSIRGDRVGTLPLQIADDYKKLDRASRMAIKSKL